MSRPAVIVAALLVTASGLAFGASMAIGARSLVELALGPPIQGVSPPAERVSAETRHPAGWEPSGTL